MLVLVLELESFSASLNKRLLVSVNIACQI